MRRGYDVTDVADKIRRLAGEDLPAKAIAERVGCSFPYAAKIIRAWRVARANRLAAEGLRAP